MSLARAAPLRLLAACLAPLLLLPACKREADAPADAPVAEVPQLPPAPTDDWSSNPAALRIQADVKALADDALQGRETGTPGYDRAADYVAKHYLALGLRPAGDDGGFFQRVPLLRATRLREGAQLEIRRNGRRIALRFRDQFLPQPDFNAPRAQIEAPAVFVGQGVHAPELGHDDFAGLDLRGKIAVLFGGAPAAFDHDRRAFHAALPEKLRAIAARGAVGAVLINTPEDEAGLPWSRGADAWQRPWMRLRDEAGKPVDALPQLRVVAQVAAAAADLVFADQPRMSAELFDQARRGTLKGFALPGTLALASRSRIDALDSRNVLAALPGGDQALAREHMVYTAHLDHIGTGAAAKGDGRLVDNIYNGAIDNALGVAIMLESARVLAAAKPPAKRSLLFAALAGEEKGLLGAQWLATHPPAGATFVANLNLDMPVLMAPSTDVAGIGAEHSSLQDTLAGAAKDIGVTVSPDPFPEETAFQRSDQYAFVRAGIPALYLVGGVTPADADKTRDPKVALRYYLRNCYHQPCDDAAQPIQYGDAERMARLSARIGRRVGDAAQAPRWKPGDFFAARFAAGR
ncbi:M28 family metallopeptidase [Luteimonas aquatica]|uniref:M28 family metallopeptidase n=1 Tax=Luteimonas aquatica TaxID=450364 RepID=UPI001F57B1D5|nr:M28 family metallopeptidase [Luteimonas aquatica]